MPSDEMPALWCSWENCCSSELLAPLTPQSHWLPSSSLSYTDSLPETTFLPLPGQVFHFLQAFAHCPKRLCPGQCFSHVSTACLAHGRSFIDTVLGWFCFLLFIYFWPCWEHRVLTTGPPDTILTSPSLLLVPLSWPRSSPECSQLPSLQFWGLWKFFSASMGCSNREGTAPGEGIGVGVHF